MSFTNSVSLPEQLDTSVDLIRKNAVTVNMECRYNAQIKVGSGNFNVQEIAQKQNLMFDLTVVSTIEVNEQLKNPESRVYQNEAGRIVEELFLNWSSDQLVPTKIEVLQFVFVDRTDKRRSTNQDVHVALEFTFQNNLGIPEPEEEEVEEFVEEIINT